MSDRMAVMKDGVILEEGTPGALYARPCNRLVADFLGAMNFTEGVVRRCDGQGVIVSTEQLGEVEASARDGLAPGDRVSVGIRPENMVLGGDASASASNATSGTLVETAFLGGRTLCYIRTREGTEPVVVAVQGADIAGVERGNIGITWARDAVLLFKNPPAP